MLSEVEVQIKGKAVAAIDPVPIWELSALVPGLQCMKTGHSKPSLIRNLDSFSLFGTLRVSESAAIGLNKLKREQAG